jgi:hypothetical protein
MIGGRLEVAFHVTLAVGFEAIAGCGGHGDVRGEAGRSVIGDRHRPCGRGG